MRLAVVRGHDRRGERLAGGEVGDGDLVGGQLLVLSRPGDAGECGERRDGGGAKDAVEAVLFHDASFLAGAAEVE